MNTTTPTLEQKLKEEAYSLYPGYKVVFALPKNETPVCMFGADNETDLLEAHKATISPSIDIPAELAHMIHMRGTKSKTMLTHVIKRAVEETKDRIINKGVWSDYKNSSLDEITAKILEEVA